MRRTLVIDCNGLCHAARIAQRGLSYEQQGTGVIFGFLSQILSLSESFDPCSLVFCWDSRKSLRKTRFPGYKDRKPKDQTLDEEMEYNAAMAQFNVLRREILPRLGFKNNFMQVGHEADDLMALVVEDIWDRTYTKPIMVTNDKDMYQCLRFCDIYKRKPIPGKKGKMTWSMYTSTDFIAEWGIEPRRWGKVKQIGGCSTDTVPGIRGIAEKTACDYLLGRMKHTSVRRQAIESKAGKAIIKFNKYLVVLPLPSTKPMKIVPDMLSLEGYKEVAKEYGMTSLLHGYRFQQWDHLIDDIPF